MGGKTMVKEYIEKAEANKAITKDMGPHRTHDFNAGCARAVNRIIELPAADVVERPRWIPVTERLPEKNQVVVAHEGKGTWDFGMFRGISASGNPEYWHWKKNTFKHVKWWMPKDGALPDPPKEEK